MNVSENPNSVHSLTHTRACMRVPGAAHKHDECDEFQIPFLICEELSCAVLNFINRNLISEFGNNHVD